MRDHEIGADPGGASLLVARAGGHRVALPVRHVIEVFRPLETETVPGAPTWILGAAVVRGALAPVVDLRRALGWDEDVPTRRYVSLRLKDRGVVLAVDDVEGVVAISEGELAALPPLLRAEEGADTVERAVVDAIGLRDRALLFVLQDAVRVPDEVWERLDSVEEE